MSCCWPVLVHSEFRCAAPTAQQSSKERLPLTSSGERSGGHVQVAADCALDTLEALPVHVTLVCARDESEPLLARLTACVRSLDACFVAGAVLGLAVRIGAAVRRVSYN